jgi:hypothetical protein
MTHASRPFPSGRYTHTNPLRRQFGLKLLALYLPPKPGTALKRAWKDGVTYDGKQAIQSRHRERPDEATLLFLPPMQVGLQTQIELAASRRIVETSHQEITREERNALLLSQGAYLGSLYRALVFQLGEAAAQAEFERLVLWAH